MLIALIASGCSSSRKACEVAKSSEFRVESVESVQKVDSVVVAIRDTVREVTTIHIKTNEAGDTLKVAQVTERDRIRNANSSKLQDTKVVVVRDTVFVEKKDSLSVTTNGSDPTKGKPAIVASLKWVFWIIIALTMMFIIIKVSRFFRV